MEANGEGPGDGGSVGSLLEEATRRLAAGGIEAPAREARLLLAHAMGVSAGDLLRFRRDEHVAAPGLGALVGRRAEAREPLAFIVGARGFWSLDLAVSPATLIPRADTETLIEAALAACPDPASVGGVLDLGTGTGAILLAALSEYPGAFGLGIDRVEAACHLARANAVRTGMAGRAAFLCGDWAAAIESRFDLVFSNPPYIVSDEIAALMPEVANHEPASALDGGPDGLDAYRIIIRSLPRLLSPGGRAILEVGQGQAADVAGLAAAAGLACEGVRADLGGTPRAVVLVR